ncbi:MAG: 4-hydroxy-tetrahydrodipicolinate synthase [Defluviitaleaceae bacterium]|nr:4-hydroxy-tetrahydrodipicolinate synthase [Defluviitaleaceae bacterium]
MIFKGSGTALVTPFTDKGEVNYAKFEQLIDFQIENGTNALIVCGTTGESPTLKDDEKLELLSTARSRADGRVKVILGTGGNDTEHAARLTKAAAARGADAAMVVTPYYNKTTPEGLAAHYTHISKSADIPIIVYNVPARTGFNVTPEMNLALSKIPNVTATKEASGNIVQIMETAALCGDALAIYSGNDDYVIPLMAVGGLGVISTVGNIIPKDVSDMTNKFLSGEHAEALKLQLGMMGLIRAIFCEVNPIPVKEAMNLMGMAVGGYRLPLVEMTGKNREFLISEMKSYGIEGSYD